jgi:fructose-1-phosphate kinase PfkB-like protein
VEKARKAGQAGVAGVELTFVSPNVDELYAMAESYSAPLNNNNKNKNLDGNENRNRENLEISNDLDSIKRQGMHLLRAGVGHVIVTMGPEGAFLLYRKPKKKIQNHNPIQNQNHNQNLNKNKQQQQQQQQKFQEEKNNNIDEEEFDYFMYHFKPNVSTNVVSVTGAGDCLVGGVVWALLTQRQSNEISLSERLIESLPYGMAAAKFTVESEAAVSPKISAGTVLAATCVGAPTNIVHIPVHVHVNKNFA